MRVIIFILMALPLAWFYVAMYWGFTITKDIAAFERGESMTLPVLPPIKWLNDRGALQTAFSTEEITTGRSVSTEITVPFAELLQDGEALPPVELKPLYATLRASAYLMPLCDEMLGTLALACEIGAFKASVRHPGDHRSLISRAEYPEDGLVILKGAIHYLPAYALGNPAIVPNADMNGARMRLLQGAQVPDTAAGRQEIFAEALALCDGLRDRFGNCVIRQISLDPGPPQRDDPDGSGTLRATASFNVLVDKTKYRRDGVQAALDEVATSRLAAIENPDDTRP
ncbi:MAG: hypothetical protein AAF222_10460 [Pseudomonadota bacterium]